MIPSISISDPRLMSQPLSPPLGHTGEFSGEGLESSTHGLPLSSSPNQARSYWKPPLEDPKGQNWWVEPKITMSRAFGQKHHLSLLRVLLGLVLCCSGVSYNSLITPFWSAGHRWYHDIDIRVDSRAMAKPQLTSHNPQASILN